MEQFEACYLKLAASFVRGKIPQILRESMGSRALVPLDQLADEDLKSIVRLGYAHGLKLHKFKRTMGLRRVERVLGMLRGMQPATILDIGSGRGAFLWPLLEALPETVVTCVDVLPHRVRDILAVREGGVGRLNALEMSASKLAFAESEFDVVTFLEVLEHIPEPQSALNEAVRVARRFVIASVPSKPDNNPEHLHLFTREALETLFKRAGARSVAIEHVLNHTIAVGRVR